jgi:hypothetical protein
MAPEKPGLVADTSSDSCLVFLVDQPGSLNRNRVTEDTMYKIMTKLLAAIAVMFALAATPAAAQATRTWVSGVGDDVNPCSRTAPCKTFAGAISKTAAGGQISVLDPGGFGAITITKSITLKADGDLGSILASGITGIIINAAATDKVVIDGIDIDGAGGTLGTIGIRILSARDVFVHRSNIRNFSSAGIQVEGTNQISVTVDGTSIFNATRGVNVISAGGNGTARVYDSILTANSVAGISVSGAGNRAEISGNQIIRSPKGLEILSGGVVNSYNDNVLTAGDAPVILPKG